MGDRIDNSINTPHGKVFNALEPNMTPGVWDRLSEIQVLIANGMTLQSADEDDMLVQALNATCIGGEVVQYSTATDLGNGLWSARPASSAACAAPNA